MYFTQDDYKKIAQYLGLHGKKDTQFKVIDSIKDDDSIVIVQNGVNYRIKFKTLFKLLKASPICKAWIDDLFAGRIKVPTEEWCEDCKSCNIDNKNCDGDCDCEEASLEEVLEAIGEEAIQGSDSDGCDCCEEIEISEINKVINTNE